MKRLLLSILALLLLCSCGHKVILDQSHTFADTKWMRFDDPVQFQFTNNNVDNYYNLTLSLAIDTARYRQKGLPLTIELISPNGEKRTMFSDIVLKNHEDRWMGEVDSGGLLHVTKVIRQYYSFNDEGQFALNIMQRTNKYEICGIQSLHMKIERVKLEYPE